MPGDLYPEPTALILVVVMNNPRDMEIARLLGWYRIPLHSAPKVISVDYLAFYQTAAFSEEKWRVQYIAPVLGHELSTRLELLKDEPNHPRAHQEYYKIQIGAIRRLPKPVLAENWRRITFLYTTGEYFQHADTINDLIVHPEDRQVLWQALHERASQNQEYHPAEEMKLDLDADMLAALLGIREASTSYGTDQSVFSDD